MRRIIILVHNIIYGGAQRIISLIKLFTCKSLWQSTSYYPEFKEQRRSKIVIILMQLVNIIQYGKPNRFFFAYGLDIKHFHHAKGYVDEIVFLKRRNALNHLGRADSSIAVLRNKFLFGLVANQLGFPHPQELGIIDRNGVFLFDTCETVDLQQYVSVFRGGGICS